MCVSGSRGKMRKIDCSRRPMEMAMAMAIAISIGLREQSILRILPLEPLTHICAYRLQASNFSSAFRTTLGCTASQLAALFMLHWATMVTLAL